MSELERVRKAELHVHLRGAIPKVYLSQLIRKYPPATALKGASSKQVAFMSRHPGIMHILSSQKPDSELDALFQYANFEQFLAAYLFTSYFVRDIEDFRGLVENVRHGFLDQNIIYVEVTVSLIEYMQQGIALGDLLAVLSEDPPGAPRIRWIVDLVRNIGAMETESLLLEILPLKPPTVIGVTLGGAEHRFPPSLFKRVYEIARENGLRTTVHAGEAVGPEGVWDALRVLKVERIGHGVRSTEDPDLVRYLAEHQIPLEVCPSSNICTGVYSSMSEHPVRKLLEAGVPLTINTDDPTFFGVSLAEELDNLLDVGFSPEEIHGLVNNAFRYAFDDEVRAWA